MRTEHRESKLDSRRVREASLRQMSRAGVISSCAAFAESLASRGTRAMASRALLRAHTSPSRGRSLPRSGAARRLRLRRSGHGSSADGVWS